MSIRRLDKDLIAEVALVSRSTCFRIYHGVGNRFTYERVRRAAEALGMPPPPPRRARGSHAAAPPSPENETRPPGANPTSAAGGDHPRDDNEYTGSKIESSTSAG